MAEHDSSSKVGLEQQGCGDHEDVHLVSAAHAPAFRGSERSAAATFGRIDARLEPAPLAAERELVRALRAREATAGERLYDLLVGTVDRAISRTLGPGQPEHDDLVQATFEQLVVTLADGKFRHDCSLKSWAASIASHLALNTIRSRRRERAVFDRGQVLDDDHFQPPGPACTERQVESRRQLDRLRRELGSMSEERAHAVLLHHVLGHDLKDIALLLGISVAAAQSRVNRGRHELQERMDRASEDGNG